MRLTRSLLLALVLAFFAVFLALPLYAVLAEGLQPAVILEVFRNPVYVEGLVNAFRIALVTTVFVFAIAVPLALLYDRYEFRGKALVQVLILVPMILPPFVGALGFQQIFGHYGVLNALLGTVGLAPRD